MSPLPKSELLEALQKRQPQYLKEYINHPLVQVGDYTYGSELKVHFLSDPARLTIGKFCSISKGVEFMMGGNHRTDTTSSFIFYKFAKDFPEIEPYLHDELAVKPQSTTIGNDVWIGYNALIFGGVTIGDGAVIGANALVTKDVAPYSIVAGNPAKEIRKRFDNPTIEKLLSICWWNWPVEKIRQNIGLIIKEPKRLIEAFDDGIL